MSVTARCQRFKASFEKRGYEVVSSFPNKKEGIRPCYRHRQQNREFKKLYKIQ